MVSIFPIYQDWANKASRDFELQASSSHNKRKTLTLLTKSSLLSPSDSKRLKIIEILDKDADRKALEYHLRRLRSDGGLATAASYFYLEADFKVGDILKNKIFDSTLRVELDQAKDFLIGVQSPSEEWLKGPKLTSVGRVLEAVSLFDYTRLSKEEIPESQFVDIFKNSGSNLSTTLAIEEYFSRKGLYQFSVYIIERIELAGGSSEITRLRYAKNQESLGKLEDSLKAYEEAYNIDPSDEDALVSLIAIARKNERSDLADFYAEKLRYIRALKKESGFVR